MPGLRSNRPGGPIPRYNAPLRAPPDYKPPWRCPLSDEQNPQEQVVSENELIRVRREKLARIAELGWDAYPTKAKADSTITEVVEKYSPRTGEELDALTERVSIAGRIMAIRDFGKASFIVLSEVTSRIQVYVRKDALSEDEWALKQNLDVGDWVSVEGPMMRTKKGELSVKADTLTASSNDPGAEYLASPLSLPAATTKVVPELTSAITLSWKNWISGSAGAAGSVPSVHTEQ